MNAAAPLASPGPSQSTDNNAVSKNTLAERKDGDGFPKNDPADWTCYSSGAYTTDWVARAAEDPAAPTDILSMLAESCNVDVRMAVADNPSSLLETLTMLAQDQSSDVRYQLAENHNIDESILELLAEDLNPYIAHRAKKTLKRLELDASVFEVVPIMSITRLASVANQNQTEKNDLLRKIAAQALQASVTASRAFLG
jgi:hypothetical protein